MISALPKPGYVYSIDNPSLPGVVKIGHTHRPPHLRAAELSRTALPLPFELRHARFFWNAPAAERVLHAHFGAYRFSRRREFFHAPLDAIALAMDGLDHSCGLRLSSVAQDFDPDAPGSWRHADPDWGVSFEGLEEQWSWAEDEIVSRDPSLRRRGWARMASLSSQGWDQGS